MKITQAALLAFDTETTGTDPAVDRVCQLGWLLRWCARTIDDGLGSAEGCELINPRVPIPSDASRVHGITDADVENADWFVEGGELADVVRALLRHVYADGTFVAYNGVRFDAPLINRELARGGWRGQTLSPDVVLDPYIWACWLHPDMPSRALAPVAKHYGVELTEAHDALADARAALDVLLAMVAAGEVPDDVQLALEQQWTIQRLLAEERRHLGYPLYRLTRDEGVLRDGWAWDWLQSHHVGVRPPVAGHHVPLNIVAPEALLGLREGLAGRLGRIGEDLVQRECMSRWRTWHSEHYATGGEEVDRG